MNIVFPVRYNSKIEIVLILLGIIGTSLAHYFTPSSLILWHNIFQRLYYLPIVYAAVRFGWIGGLLAALFAGFCYIPHILTAWPFTTSPSWLEPAKAEPEIPSRTGLPAEADATSGDLTAYPSLRDTSTEG